MNYLTYKPTAEEYNRYCPRWKKTLDLTIYAVALIGIIWGLMFLGHVIYTLL